MDVKPKTINIWLVATVSAVVNGILGALFVALLFPTVMGALPGRLASEVTSGDRMVVAVAFPFVFAAMCFGLGALMAFLYNMFHAGPAQAEADAPMEPLEDAEPASAA